MRRLMGCSERGQLWRTRWLREAFRPEKTASPASGQPSTTYRATGVMEPNAASSPVTNEQRFTKMVMLAT